ncbi:LysR family transcriptional regulator [Paenibacillus sp. MBLB4367]|uniref:LysR family transcriptional regulator n=1 Tax=Paenibacillus sp. MBLB4367 TaxID=3384767 RepID=UPI00390802DB
MENLEWYRIFLHTAKTGNLTKAAQALYMTQPSVSYAIKQLEEALGVKLFQRFSRGVALTAEGRALYHYVEQSFALLDTGEQKLHALKAFAGGELRLGASDSLFKHVLLPHLGVFRSRFPGIRIRLSHGKSGEIADRVRDGRIDYGFIHLPMQELQAPLQVRPMFAIQDVFVVGEAFRELADRNLTAAELAGVPLLLLSPGSSTRRFVERWFAAQGLEAEADMELGSVDLLIEFARLGYGAAFVTRSFVEEELKAGTLYELRTAEPIPSRSVAIVQRSDMALSLASEQFLHMLLDSLSQ